MCRWRLHRKINKISNNRGVEEQNARRNLLFISLTSTQFSPLSRRFIPEGFDVQKCTKIPQTFEK